MKKYMRAIEHKGYTATISIHQDEDHGAPWKENDGHGVVSEWTTREKRAGEPLNELQSKIDDIHRHAESDAERQHAQSIMDLVHRAVNEHAALVAVAEAAQDCQRGGEAPWIPGGTIQPLIKALANLAAIRKSKEVA